LFGGESLKRNINLPLTETVFYILTALIEPAHGYLKLQKSEELSNGGVRMAAGTLYGAIESLLKQRYIQPIPSEDPRRKVYQITNSGKEILRLDVLRMQHMEQVALKQLEEK
jgi:DNA-binding PadR family transcriptional regulator